MHASCSSLYFLGVRFPRFFRIKEGVLIAEPELTVHEVRPTANGVAFLVLGSDGLWDGVPDSKVRKAISVSGELNFENIGRQ